MSSVFWMMVCHAAIIVYLCSDKYSRIIYTTQIDGDGNRERRVDYWNGEGVQEMSKATIEIIQTNVMMLLCSIGGNPSPRPALLVQFDFIDWKLLAAGQRQLHAIDKHAVILACLQCAMHNQTGYIHYISSWNIKIVWHFLFLLFISF